MFPIMAFTAAAGAIGGIASTALTNQANSAINSRSLEHQLHMRDTAYQATMADMRKAGLNPILAASRGATQPGSVPSMIPMQNPAQSVSQLATTAADVSLKGQQQEVAIQEAKKKAQEVISEKLRNGRIILKDPDTGKFVMGLIETEAFKNAAMAKYYGNQSELDQILLNFYNDVEVAKIAKDLGVTPATVKMLFQAIFSRGK